MTAIPIDLPADPPASRRLPGWLARARPHWVFLVVAGVMGTLLSFVTPPVQVPDEEGHLYRAYQISTGVLVSPHMGADVPISLLQMAGAYQRLKFHPAEKTTVAEVRAEFARPLNPEATGNLSLPGAAIYSPVPYAPQAVGMALARRLTRSAGSVLYAGRLANAWAYALLGCLAIGLSPMLKWPACILLSAPFPLMLAGSLSEDPMTVAMTVLAVALVLRLACSPGPATTGAKLALVVVLMGVGLCKSVYSPVVILLVGVPAARWGPGLRRWAWPAATALAVAAAVGTWSSLANPLDVHQRNKDPRVELRWAVYHPGSFLGDIGRSMNLWGESFITDAIGHLGWGEFTPSIHFLDAVFVIMAWASLKDESPAGLPLALRAAAVAAGAACVLAFCLSIFALWHLPGEREVLGIQGRYFMPVIFLTCVAIRRRDPGRGISPPVALCLLALSSAYTLWVIVDRYYCPA